VQNCFIWKHKHTYLPKMQPQGHVQVLLNMLRGMPPQAALDAPRFCISAGSPDAEVKDSTHAGDINAEVYIEEGIPQSTIDALCGACSELEDRSGTSSRPNRDGARCTSLSRGRPGPLWSRPSDPAVD
jgi:gamma-glutamyltranspeptidase/glutathione hydrolase